MKLILLSVIAFMFAQSPMAYSESGPVYVIFKCLSGKTGAEKCPFSETINECGKRFCYGKINKPSCFDPLSKNEIKCNSIGNFKDVNYLNNDHKIGTDQKNIEGSKAGKPGQ